MAGRPSGVGSRAADQSASGHTALAIFTATCSSVSSPVLSPDRDASRRLSSRSSSYVRPWKTGMTRSVASSADNSLSAMPSAARLFKNIGRSQDDADMRYAQTFVDLAHQGCTQGNVLLLEPHSRAEVLQEVVEFLRGSTPVLPGVAQENVATLRVRCCLLLSFGGYRPKVRSSTGR